MIALNELSQALHLCNDLITDTWNSLVFGWSKIKYKIDKLPKKKNSWAFILRVLDYFLLKFFVFILCHYLLYVQILYQELL